MATYSVSIPVWSCSGSAILAKPKSHILEERERGKEERGREGGRRGRVKENTDKRNTENSTKLETQCQNRHRQITMASTRT